MEDAPGCPGIVPEDEEPVDINSAEHQDAIQKAFNEIAEVMEAQDMERAAKSQGHNLRTSTATERTVGESSTQECEEVGNNDFNSEDDADLLKCAESDN